MFGNPRRYMDCGGAQERWKLRQGKQDLIVHSLGRSPPGFLARAHSFGRRIFIQINYPNLRLFMARSIEDTVLMGDKFMRFSNIQTLNEWQHTWKCDSYVQNLALPTKCAISFSLAWHG